MQRRISDYPSPAVAMAAMYAPEVPFCQTDQEEEEALLGNHDNDHHHHHPCEEEAERSKRPVPVYQYRHRTFAERLGPRNAKSIVFHYIGVIALSYSLIALRAYVVEYAGKCSRRPSLTTTTTTTTTTPAPLDLMADDYDDDDNGPSVHYVVMASVEPYWLSTVCTVRFSRNWFVIAFRKYMDFTTYYVAITVVLLNTLIMLLLGKHLWRALRLKDESRFRMINNNGRRKNGKSGGGDKAKKEGNVSINIGDCSGGGGVPGCIPEDNFLIEVILALFDFFRLTQTKQD